MSPRKWKAAQGGATTCAARDTTRKNPPDGAESYFVPRVCPQRQFSSMFTNAHATPACCVSHVLFFRTFIP